MNELIKSKIVGNNTAIRTFQENTLEIYRKPIQVVEQISLSSIPAGESIFNFEEVGFDLKIFNVMANADSEIENKAKLSLEFIDKNQMKLWGVLLRKNNSGVGANFILSSPFSTGYIGKNHQILINSPVNLKSIIFWGEKVYFNLNMVETIVL